MTRANVVWRLASMSESLLRRAARLGTAASARGDDDGRVARRVRHSCPTGGEVACRTLPLYQIALSDAPGAMLREKAVQSGAGKLVGDR
jgi:hypothetical protein